VKIVCIKRGILVSHFVNIWVVHSIHESNRGRLVRVIDGELHPDFPHAALVGCCISIRDLMVRISSALRWKREAARETRRGQASQHRAGEGSRARTVFGSMELDIELGHVVLDRLDFVVAHHSEGWKIGI